MEALDPNDALRCRDSSVTSRLFEGGWLTTGEAETLTGYAQAYLRRLAERNRIVARKVGRDWLLNQESLRAYRDEMATLGAQRHNPWREELTACGLGRRLTRTEAEVTA